MVHVVWVIISSHREQRSPSYKRLWRGLWPFFIWPWKRLDNERSSWEIGAKMVTSAAAAVIRLPTNFVTCSLPATRSTSLNKPNISHFPSSNISSPRPPPTASSLPRSMSIRAARAESKGVSLGFRAPDFQLPEPLTGKVWKLDDFEPYPALLVMFICNHCPFVKHLKHDIVKLTNFYAKKGLAAVAISSNSIRTHPQDGPGFMAEEAKYFNYPFPYLYDESQDVARAFGAVCTPEFFLFKKDGRRPFELFYHGQFDDSRPGKNIPITGRDLSLAIDAVLSGQGLTSPQKPSIGCSIKWHPQTNQ